jgi:TRAP-type C4-dicarboxylate transport system permease small subunit
LSAPDRVLIRLEDALLAVSCLCVLAIVAITTADVVSRTAFNAPFAWSHDLITQYLLVAMFFLSLPYVTRVGGHMSLDFLARKVRAPRLRGALVLLGEVLAVLLVLGFVWGALGTAIDAYRGGDMLQGDLPWPTWPSRLLGPVGASVLALRMMVRIGQTIGAMRHAVMPSFLGQGIH